MFHNIAKTVGTFVLLSLFSSNVFSSVTTNQDNRVDAFVQTLVKAYENHDLNKIVDSYTPNAVVIGTGKNEIFQGRKQIAEAFKREFAQHTNATIGIKRISIALKNNLAIASYLLKANVQLPNSKSFQSELRLSLVLLKDHQNWRIVQSHLSAPLADQQAGQSFPQKD